MLMNSKTAQMELYDAKISLIVRGFELDARLTKVNKGKLLTIDNPRYDTLIKSYPAFQRSSNGQQ